MKATTTTINGFTQVTIGSLRFFLNPENLSLKDMAKKIGFDLQKRIVLDFENEYSAICEYTNTTGMITIITRSIFSK